MRFFQGFFNCVPSLFRRNTVEQELGGELRFHIERQEQENLVAGMSPEEARRAALREFGGVEQVKEECRDTYRANYMENLAKDIRYGLRMLQKSPSFTFFAVAVLSLGIAANSAIFSIADNVLVRPLPYRDSNRLVMVWEDASAYGFPRDTPAPGNFADWKARNQVFEDMAASAFSGSFNLTGEGTPEEIPGDFVTANLFSVLGARPALGRDFSASDDVPGAPRVVILSQRLFLRRFDGDPQIIGKQLWLNYEKYDVVGVMPRGFQFPDRDPQLWAPMQFTPAQLANHGNHHLQVVARLKPGV